MKTRIHGRTTSTHGTTTLRTASEVPGTGAVTTTLGTETHGTGVHGLTHLGDTTDGMIRSITEDIMILGTTAMADITEDGMIHGTDTCTRTTADGTADGIHIGTTITTTTLPYR